MSANGSEVSSIVFISYCRRDAEFVTRLLDRLTGPDVEILIDQNDIVVAEDWWNRIKELIEEADTLLTVISPEFAKSQECQKELEHALALNKRIIPILAEDTDIESLNPELRKLNFAVATSDTGAEPAIDDVVRALRTNTRWLRQHSEYTRQSLSWHKKGRPKGLLIQSPLLEEIEGWAADRPHGTELIYPIITEHLSASRQHGKLKHARNISMALIVCFVTSVLAMLAFYQKWQADDAREQAVRATAKYDVVRAAVESPKVRNPGAAVITPQLLKALDQTVLRSVQRKSILWVDGKRSNNDSESKALLKMDFTIDYARDAREAIRRIDSDYDLIITHFGKNGSNKYDSVAYTLIKELEQLRKSHIPVIIYTTGVTKAYRCDAQKHGFYDETDEPAELFVLAVHSVTGIKPTSQCGTREKTN